MFKASRVVIRVSRNRFSRSYSSPASEENRGLASRTTSVIVSLSSLAAGWYLKDYLVAQEHISKGAVSAQLGPSLAQSSNHGYTQTSNLTPSEVTKTLYSEAFAQHPEDLGRVDRYDGTRVASNHPSEDHFVHGLFESPRPKSKDWMAWGIFDGHAGWEMASLLSEELVLHVQKELRDVLKLHESTADEPKQSAEIIQSAIKTAFVTLDDKIMQDAVSALRSPSPFAEMIPRLVLGYAGSCALLSLYDPTSHLLHVACTGDSRAVLGEQRPDGSWETLQLSIDQTPKNAAEAARLVTEHPNEPDLLKNDRVLGIAVSRAFGDGRWKWDRDTQETANKRYNGPTVRPNFKSPPYLTAEPVITTTPIKGDRPSFLIMASDGLWDHMSSEQAVDLVAKWISRTSSNTKPVQPSQQRPPFDLGPFENETWQLRGDEVTCEDDNAAVHLVRNALGGSYHDKIGGVLSFKAPRSRDVRDDITVQVVFFGKGEK